MKGTRFWVAAAGIFCLCSTGQAQNTPSVAGSSSEHAKAVFAVAVSFTEVNWNAYFGEKEANRAAFDKLKADAARLNEPRLEEKIQRAEPECLNKGCKATIPPLSDAAKEWTKLQKRLGPEAGYAMMGIAVATTQYYFDHSPKLHETLRVHMNSASMTATNAASKACQQTAGCPASVHDAFEKLNAGLGDYSLTARDARKLMDTIRHELGVGE